MNALVTIPGRPGGTQLAQVSNLQGREVLVETLEVGVCGTDRDIDQGTYGSSPPGRDDLVLGHEVIGVVRRATRTFASGDLVAATVRRGCNNCSSCRSGSVDSCLSGLYTERGVVGLDGFAAELFDEDAENLIPIPAELGRLGVLAEPTSVCERALRHAVTIAGRQPHQWSQTVVLGSGTIGLLTTMLLRLSELSVLAMDRAPADSEKAMLVRRTGAEYVSLADTSIAEATSSIGNIDLIVEATGAAERLHEAIPVVGRNGVLCLIGVETNSHRLELDSLELGQRFVDDNKALFGSVSAARQDWNTAVSDLSTIGQTWPGLLPDLIGLRVEPTDFEQAFAYRGVKATLRFA